MSLPSGRRAPAGAVAMQSIGLDRTIRTLVALSASLAMALAMPARPGNDVLAVSERPTTELTIGIPASVDLGQHPQARVRLTAGGMPVNGELVSVRLGTTISQQVTTGPDGTGTAIITRDLSAATYQVVATFAGTARYQSSTSSTATLIVKPAQLTIATVPPIPDVPLIRIGNGPVLMTDADGTVTATMKDVGPVTLTVVQAANRTTIRLRVDRWDDGTTESVRTIRIPDTLHLTVGLDVLYPVGFSFASPDGRPIDPASVPGVVVSDSTGTQETLTLSGPSWLASNSIIRLPTGLDSTPLEYRIVSVTLDGANVVNRGQQRFDADGPKTIPVELLVFNLDLQGTDALFRTSAGSTVTITSKTGGVRVVNLDKDARASLRLPRGDYALVVGGGLGIALSTPIVLSRDQTVNVLLISVVDVTMVLVAGVSLAIGLILIGRPHVIRRRRGLGSDGLAVGGPAGPPVSWPDPTIPRDLPPLHRAQQELPPPATPPSSKPEGNLPESDPPISRD